VAVINAFLVAPLQQQTDNPRVPLTLFNQALPTPNQAVEVYANDSGLAINIGPPGSVSPGAIINAFGIKSFEADYYHGVHIVPNPIALGNLLSDQVRTVEVWNAHESNQLLTDIASTGATGLNLTGPFSAPTTFGPLESRIYQLSVSTSGPDTIDAGFMFNFPSESPVLDVTGTRVIVWPYGPNWTQPLTERLEWLTDVIESDDGTEQRISLRAAPRRAFEYLITASQTEKRRLETLLWDWQAHAFAVPIWTDIGRLTSAAAKGDSLLSLATDDMDYHDGGLAVVMGDSSTHEVVEIGTVSSASVTLARPIKNAWPAGTRIYPARIGRLQDSQDLSLYTASLENAQVRFDIQYNSAITAAEFSATTYRGLPLLEVRPNWRDNISGAYRRKLQQFDNATGVRAVDDLSGRPVTVQDYLWTRSGRANIQAFRQWLHARAGKLTPIWVQTYQVDLVLTQDVQITDDFIRVQNVGYAQHIQQAIGRRDIAIRLIDGTVYYRRIIASLEVDSQTEQLTLDSAIGQAVNSADVQMISWLQICRIESDAIEMQWRSAGVMECRHYFRGLNDDV